MYRTAAGVPKRRDVSRVKLPVPGCREALGVRGMFYLALHIPGNSSVVVRRPIGRQSGVEFVAAKQQYASVAHVKLLWGSRSMNYMHSMLSYDCVQ